MSRPGRRKEPRLVRPVDGWVRKAVEEAKVLSGASYEAIDRQSGKRARWSRNALSRPGMLPIKTARLLMKWAEGVAAEHGDKTSLAHMRLVTFQLREYDLPARTVPMLVLHRHVDEVSAAFDTYLRRHGAASAARGLLREFLMQPDLVHERGEVCKPRHSTNAEQTYARSCAWDLSWRVRKIIASRWQSVSITGDGRRLTVSPDDLQALIYSLEYLVALDKQPRATRGKADVQRRRTRG
jgi:hypothetical protein